MTNSSQTSQLSGAVLRGAVGFSLVSLLVFATVAFGERWMYTRLTVWGAYLAWTLAFILLGGAVLGHSLAILAGGCRSFTCFGGSRSLRMRRVGFVLTSCFVVVRVNGLGRSPVRC